MQDRTRREWLACGQSIDTGVGTEPCFLDWELSLSVRFLSA
jgi:hypothetical protein